MHGPNLIIVELVLWADLSSRVVLPKLYDVECDQVNNNPLHIQWVDKRGRTKDNRILAVYPIARYDKCFKFLPPRSMHAHKHTSTQAHKHASTQAHKHARTQAHKHTPHREVSHLFGVPAAVANVTAGTQIALVKCNFFFNWNWIP
jgi:hypothetical protein